MLKIGLLSFSFVFVPLSSYSNVYTPPVFKQNLNANTYEDSTRSRKESWAFISYVIDVEGKPQNLEVISSSRLKDKTAKAKQYVENLRYIPAKRDGKPIKAEGTFLLKLQKSLWGSSNDGISTYFSRLYDEANGFIQESRFEKAKEALTDLEENKVKNLTEQAYFSWLSSLYYAQTKEWPFYRNATYDAWVLREKLNEQYAYIVTKNLFDYALYEHEYQFALTVLNSMKRLNGVDLTETGYKEHKALIVESLNSKSEITKHYAVDRKERKIYHRLAKQNILVKNVSGKVTNIELRCLNYFQSLQQVDKISVPSDGKRCKLLIAGSEGTEFSLTESGNNILLN